MSATSSSKPPRKPVVTQLTKALSYPISYWQYAANEPVITGALLYILTKGPPHIRERLLRPLQPLSLKGKARLDAFVSALKVLTVLGVFKKANNALNWLALKNWSLQRKGAPFEFGPAKKELVVITGGCSGFGYELVKDFNPIARVVIIDVSPLPAELEKLSDVHYYQCDVTDTSAVVATCEAIRQSHGHPTILINNAGIANKKTILETSNENCEKLFKVNLTSHFVLIREFLPAMLELKKGHIVTMASMASFLAVPGLVDYCCTKVGALYLTEGLRNELLSRYPGGETICTSSIHPSWHDTGIIKGIENFLEKGGHQVDPPSNVSKAVLEQVVKARSGRVYVPGSEVKKASLRNQPLWFQDFILKNVWKRKKREVVLETTDGK
ncbi:NAD(P)-binding protein [Lophiostoma macrostomum CBS 122681]|uniref:NAD(P)-binding protein n=1 Tax=Lophiostoma macrostomum CBS 122681 TaxID=1314788 RepID=A0A6A6TKE0_9PLEO|nr:NAD(P)-binding protein [Lophiostoma macrostomum CBS 122681]